MNRYIDKISSELLNSVSIQSDETVIDCIVYANSYWALKREGVLKSKNYIEFPFISAIGIKLTSKQIMRLAKTASVSFISKQTYVFAQVDMARKITKNNLNIALNGDNTTIAIIDTGLQPLLDFCLPKCRIIKFVDLINNQKTPYDDNGHGTFVGSIACGNGFVSGGKYAGFAPKSNIISIKALESNGETGAYKILEAMQWVADNYRKYNIRVVCMSFGSNPLDRNDPLIVGAETLWSMGIVVVAAAGNNGPDTNTIKSPGFSSRIITVGAMDDCRDKDGNYNESNFKVADFSSRGPAGNFYKPDVLAPGVNITGGLFSKEKLSFYTKMSGTSVATPMVAGICADVISKYPSITPDGLKVRLLNSCKRITGNHNDEGYGYIDLNMLFN